MPQAHAPVPPHETRLVASSRASALDYPSYHPKALPRRTIRPLYYRLFSFFNRVDRADTCSIIANGDSPPRYSQGIFDFSFPYDYRHKNDII